MAIWYPEADLVIRHAKVYTVAITVEEVQAGKRDFPIIEDGAVAAKDGKFIYVGDDSGIDAFIGEHTEVVDAAGEMLVPGFVESHMHAWWTGNNMRAIDFRSVTSRDEMKRLIKEYADKTPDGQWIVGYYWNELVWDVKEMIMRDELDELAPNNPFFAMRTCFHTCMANSLALEAAGVTAETPDPEGGSIEHYDNGEPNGIFKENSALDLIQSVIAPNTPEQDIESIDVVGKYLNSLGITSSIDANLGFKEMRAYLEAKKQGRLSYRANLMFYLDSAYGDRETHLRRLEEMDCVTGFGDDMLKLNGVKVTLDGIPATYTALMREGYKTRPDYCGSSVWSHEDIVAFVCEAHKRGWQFGIHTIGDKAIDWALDAFEAANEISSTQDRHHYLIHYQFPHEDNWPRMKALNVGATVQPTLVSTMGEAVDFYPEQAEIIQSPGLLFKNGVICGGSSDSPVVPPDPMMGMYYAITRLDETREGVVLSKGDESKVTPIEALIMWTKNSAWFLHDENHLGSIEVGNLADMVLCPKDFIEADVEEYRTIKVDKTYLGGKLVYQAD